MTTDITPHPNPLENSKDALIKDFRGIAGKADQLVRDTSQSMVSDLSVRGQLVTDKARELAGMTQQYASENPWRIAGIGMALGALLVALISRR